MKSPLLAEFTLSKTERDSSLWRRLSEHYRERLQTLREANDYSMPEGERHILVGQIREAKLLLALGVEAEVSAPPKPMFAV